MSRHFQRIHPGEKIDDYPCKTCGVVCETSAELKAHKAEVHKYKCKECPEYFSSTSDRQAHAAAAHVSVEALICDLCGKQYKVENYLKLHIETVHPGMKSELLEQLERKATLNGVKTSKEVKTESIKAPKTTGRFKCDICKSLFLTKDDKMNHLADAHPGMEPYQCEICGKGFNSKGGKHGHMRTHADVMSKENYKCEHCGKEFARRDSYKEHLLIHTGPRYRCPHCPREFVQKSNLARHVRLHTGEKPFKCDYCDKRFADSGACKAHMNKHTGADRCECPYCGEIYSRMSKLKHHMRTHTGEGLMECQMCEKTFTNVHSLKTHMRTMHAEDSEDTNVCSICGMKLTQKKLNDHFAKLHPDFTTNCQLCGLTFRYLSETNRHYLAAHSNLTAYGESQDPLDTDATGKVQEPRSGFTCTMCKAHFNGQTDINLHLKNEHDITMNMAFHYVNHFKNERLLPTLGKAKRVLTDDEKEQALAAKFKKYENGHKCYHCRMVFTSVKAISEHWRRRRVPISKNCHVCHAKFASRLRVNNHVMEVHPDALPNPDDMQENEDDFEYNSSHEDDFDYEVEEDDDTAGSDTGGGNEEQPQPEDVFDVMTLQCFHCRDVFNSEELLEGHWFNENVLLTKQCQSCDQEFGSKFQVNQHMLDVHDPQHFNV